MANLDLVPSARGPGKDFAAGGLSQPTTQAHVCEGREETFCQSHDSWLTLLRLSALVRGSDVPWRELIPNRTPREKIPPIACFMANGSEDLRFTLSCRPPA